MAQPVVEAATNKKDFNLHRIVRWVCGRLIRWLSDQQNVDRRHHWHQSDACPSDHPRRQARSSHRAT